MTTSVIFILGFAIAAGVVFLGIKLKLHKQYIFSNRKMKAGDFYLIFTFAAALLAAYLVYRREWHWLAFIPVCFALDFFLIPKKLYRQTVYNLRSRDARIIAGMVVIIILSMFTFDQWDQWRRLEILRTGVSASAQISSVHPRVGKYSSNSLLLWYRHPEKGIQEINHNGPLIKFDWFQPGQTIAIHYDRANPKKIAIDGREPDLFSAVFIWIFLICAALWFGARLSLPDKRV